MAFSETTPHYRKATKMFNDIANPFGANAFEPVNLEPARTLYYKGMRLADNVKLPRAPKPLSHHVKNFLLNYNG